MTNPLAQDLGGVVRLLVPEPKPMPDLLLATYHEARGWNACRDAMLKLISTHSAEIAGALRDAESWRAWRELGEHEAADIAWLNAGEERDAALDAIQQGGGGGE